MSKVVAVSEGAQDTPIRKTINKKGNIKKSLADYVSKEYPGLTNQDAANYSIPAEFPLTEFPLNKGDMAELEIFMWIMQTRT